jgi:UDP-glucose 4-epimerase
MPKILITGGQGFIGKYLSQAMRGMGWQVFDPGKGELDIRVPSSFKLLEGIKFDAVVHLAALLMIDGHAPEKYFETNAMGTFNVLDFCRQNGIKTLIYTMTHSDTNHMSTTQKMRMASDVSHFFGTSSWERAKNVIPFVSSKIAAMDMINAYTHQQVLRGVILRLANIRGYGSQDSKYGCVFHQFVQKAIKGEDIEIWGDPPKTVRDMIYVKDVVRAIIIALQNSAAHGTYNVGTGIGLTIENEAKAIIEVFGKTNIAGFKLSRLIYRPDLKEYRKISCVFDIEKTMKELLWSPRYTYREGLEDFKREMEINEVRVK